MAFCACGELAQQILKVVIETDGGTVLQLDRTPVCQYCAVRVRAAAQRAILPAKRSKKIQPSFAGLTPDRKKTVREQSMAEAWYQLFEEARAAKIEGLGGNPRENFSRPASVLVNTIVKTWISFCGGDEDRCADVLGAYVGEFLRDPWAAGLEPAFPWRALFSEKVWRPRFAKILAELKDAQEPN